MTNRKSLKQTLTDGEFVIAPGVFDMFSARIADQLDFKALYMTGYGVSASYLGLADAGLITYTEMVARAGTIAQGIGKPLLKAVFGIAHEMADRTLRCGCSGREARSD